MDRLDKFTCFKFFIVSHSDKNGGHLEFFRGMCLFSLKNNY